ncbi:MAG: hypothetical protein WCV88_01935 [Patescibacteria group bacterium]|jgi:glycerol-3-phosphate cytidylyltransferase-like family protein
MVAQEAHIPIARRETEPTRVDISELDFRVENGKVMYYNPHDQVLDNSNVDDVYREATPAILDAVQNRWNKLVQDEVRMGDDSPAAVKEELAATRNHFKPVMDFLLSPKSVAEGALVDKNFVRFQQNFGVEDILKMADLYSLYQKPGALAVSDEKKKTTSVVRFEYVDSAKPNKGWKVAEVVSSDEDNIVTVGQIFRRDLTDLPLELKQGLDQTVAAQGETVSTITKDMSDAKEAARNVTKLQNEILNKKPETSPDNVEINLGRKGRVIVSVGTRTNKEGKSLYTIVSADKSSGYVKGTTYTETTLPVELSDEIIKNY